MLHVRLQVVPTTRGHAFAQLQTGCPGVRRLRQGWSVPGRSVDFGCEYCGDDSNRLFGHLDQIGNNEDRWMILLRHARCRTLYENSPAGLARTKPGGLPRRRRHRTIPPDRRLGCLRPAGVPLPRRVVVPNGSRQGGCGSDDRGRHGQGQLVDHQEHDRYAGWHP